MRKILLSLVITLTLVLGAVFPLLTTNKITAQAEVSSLESLPYKADTILNSKEFRLVKEGDNLTGKQIFIVIENYGEMVAGATVVCGNDVIFASSQNLVVGTKSGTSTENAELSEDDISISQSEPLVIGNKVYATMLANNTNCVDFARAETGVKGNNYIGVYVFDPEDCGLEERELQVGDKLPSAILKLYNCDSLLDHTKIDGLKIDIDGSYKDCSLVLMYYNSKLTFKRVECDGLTYNVSGNIYSFYQDGVAYVILSEEMSFSVKNANEVIERTVFIGENLSIGEINGKATAYAYFETNAPEEPTPGESEEEQESEELKPGESEEEQESEELKPSESEEESKTELVKWFENNLGISVSSTMALLIVALLAWLIFKK